ncbi:amino acid transporter heavy chain SLC3A2-like [Cylas formicarius]|uniref:amino acid transporter heavy chain SLC3A2-like n=1 Tax=Cylas formicarius TaxID=197179 RepID=UPI0029589855|nr:amino acid transporter heavy chain SLC3A2-like [Cylas formicarius]
MDGFLGVDHGSNLPSSPSNSFMADEVASICPLITPSPPTNDLINPLPEPSESNFVIGEELAEKLQHVKDDHVDSASSTSSAEPACTQLLNHRNSMYHHIAKEQEATTEEANDANQPLQLTFRNPPEDYFFMSWNWPMIRKISLWIFMSGLVAMLALVVAMIYNLPKTCNPPTQWYQGHLFYEIFPAGFYSSSHGKHGDLRGISMKMHYIERLGVRAVRLNSIFRTQHYPVDFENATNLRMIDPSLGTYDDLRDLAKNFKSRNISLLLDIPVSSLLIKQGPINHSVQIIKNSSHQPAGEFLKAKNDVFVQVEEVLAFWSANGIDGFYLKGLESFIEDVDFPSYLRRWKKILGPEKIIMVSEHVIHLSPKPIVNIVLNNVDLVDVKLDIEKGVLAVSKQIDSIQNGTLFSERSMPWIHWSLANVNSNRLASILPFGNATLGATLLQMMLPGTPSIFYGDEIGLQDEKSEFGHLHQLGMMPWNHRESNIQPWVANDEPEDVFDQTDVISQMVALRSASPSIYMNAVFKENVNKVNAEVKYSQKDFLVIQRWYPRRKSYVVASNMGSEKISADLSALLYTGKVMVGPKAGSSTGTISFKAVRLCPGESVVIELD